MMENKKQNGMMMDDQDMEKVTGGTYVIGTSDDEESDLDHGLPDNGKKPGNSGIIMK